MPPFGEYAKKFDGYEPPAFRVSPGEAVGAGIFSPREVREELDFAMKQVEAFAGAQKSCMVPFEKELYPADEDGGTGSSPWNRAAVTSPRDAIRASRRPWCPFMRPRWRA